MLVKQILFRCEVSKQWRKMEKQLLMLTLYEFVLARLSTIMDSRADDIENGWRTNMMLEIESEMLMSLSREAISVTDE